MPKFAIQKMFENTKDIQRSYMFDLNIPEMAKYGITEDDLVIRCRTAVIPGRGNEPIESVFMGMKRFFPGKPIFPHTLAVSFEEFEDRKISTALYKWQQDIFDIEESGASLVADRKDIVKTTTLRLYGYNGELINDNSSANINFYNTWVQNVDDVALDYAAADSIKYTVTFQYDRWEMV